MRSNYFAKIITVVMIITMTFCFTSVSWAEDGASSDNDSNVTGEGNYDNSDDINAADVSSDNDYYSEEDEEEYGAFIDSGGCLNWYPYDNKHWKSNKHIIYINNTQIPEPDIMEMEGSDGVTSGYYISLKTEIDDMIKKGLISKPSNSVYTIGLEIINKKDSSSSNGLLYSESVLKFKYKSKAKQGEENTNYEEGDDDDDVVIKPWDKKEWIRILRNWTDYQEVGEYSYYFTKNNGSSIYKVYRENLKTGKRKKILQIYGNHFPEFYTNGEKLVYLDYKLGTYVKVKDLKTNKTKKILDLTKFKTSKSTDSIGALHIYGNYLYYSKIRGLNTVIWKTYKVNINSGKQTTVKSGHTVLAPEEPRYTRGRYFLIIDKMGTAKIYDARTQKTKKLTDKSVMDYIQSDDGYWYYLTCSNPKAKTKSYKVYKKAISGSGRAKLIASFKTKYTADEIVEFTIKSIYFLRNTEYSMEYRFSKKKMIKRKDRDMWYYVNKTSFTW